MVRIDARKIMDFVTDLSKETKSDYDIVQYKMMMLDTDEERVDLLQELGKIGGKFEILQLLSNTLTKLVAEAEL